MVKTRIVPLALFCAFATRILFLGATIDNAVVLLVLGLVAAFYEYKVRDKEITKLSSEIAELRNLINFKNKEVDEVKNHLAAFKIQNNLKGLK